MTFAKTHDEIFLDENNVIRAPKWEEKQFPGGIGVEFFNSMKKHHRNIGQIDAETGAVDTFGVLLKASIRIAIELKTRGITNEDIVGLCSSNNAFSCLPFYASMFIGAKFTAFDPGLSQMDMKHLLKVISPKVIFVEPCALEVIEGSMWIDEIRNMEIVVLGGKSKNHATIDDFLEAKVDEEYFEPTPVENADRTAVIVCSSGTTGFPKGVEHSHRVFLNKVHQFPVPGLVLMYSFLYGISGIMLLISLTLQGSARLLCGRFEPASAWKYLCKYQVPYAFLTTMITVDLVHYVQSIPHEAINLKMLSIIGENISQTVMEKAKQVFPGAIVLRGYGLTETAGILTAFRFPEDLHLLLKNPESVGRPIRGISYKVVDIETGKNLTFNQPGELRVYSKYLMNSYHNIDSSSDYDEDGWLKTGDIMYYDADFCFYILDRIKDAIKYCSWYIPPTLIQSILNSHPAVVASIVVAVPHERDGEHPLACVLLKEGSDNISEAEIRKFVDDKVDNRKKLRGGVRFVKTFALTPTGKIDRRKVKEALAKGII